MSILVHYVSISLKDHGELYQIFQKIQDLFAGALLGYYIGCSIWNINRIFMKKHICLRFLFIYPNLTKSSVPSASSMCSMNSFVAWKSMERFTVACSNDTLVNWVDYDAHDQLFHIIYSRLMFQLIHCYTTWIPI